MFVLMLSVFLVVAVISFSLPFLMKCSSPRIEGSMISPMLPIPLPLFFRHTEWLDITCLRCKTLCILITFLVLYSICLSSALVHLRMVPCSLLEGLPRCFRFDVISAADLGFEKFFLSSKLQFSYFFFHLRLFTDIYSQYSHVFVIFLFSKLFWFCSSIRSVRCSFHFSLSTWYVFLWQIPFLYTGCMFLLFISDSSILFSFFCKQLDVVLVHRVIKLLAMF